MITLTVGSDADNAGEQRLVAFAARAIAPDHNVDLRAETLNGSAQLNDAVQSGWLDAHTAQHWPYLRRIREANGWDVEPIAPLWIGTVSVYSRRHPSLAALGAGTQIAVPADEANREHVLRLLHRAGIAGFTEVPVPVAELAGALDDVDAAAGGTGRLVPAGVELELARFPGEAEYAKVLVGRTGDTHRAALLRAVFTDPRVAEFVAAELSETAVPA